MILECDPSFAKLLAASEDYSVFITDSTTGQEITQITDAPQDY
jgi:hypothetical protein